MKNQTYVTYFHLVPFSDYTSLTASVFFFLYIFGVIINSSIITVIYNDYQLHTPMYLFLCNLALVDICYTTTTIPNLLHMLLSGDNTVSFMQCFTQMYFYCVVAYTEDLIIIIMAYDRYVAICDPLHYHNILNRKNSLILACGAWMLGCLNSFALTVPVSHLPFCHSVNVQQFLCDVKALINISSDVTKQFYIVYYLNVCIIPIVSVMFLLISYKKIIQVILQIKSKDGRKKAFSTCSAHLTIVVIYYMLGLSVYLMPPSEYSNILEPTFTALYAVVTPMINPLVYSLRNKDVKSALRRIFVGKEK